MKIPKLTIILCAILLTTSLLTGNESLTRESRADTIVDNPHSMPASPEFFEFAQPDGSVFKARIHGDERYNWMETHDGWTVLLNGKSNFYEFQLLDEDGHFMHSGARAGIDKPRDFGIRRGVRESSEVIQERLQEFLKQEIQTAPSSGEPDKVASTGTVKKLVILANYSDTSTTYSQADFNGLFNTPGYSSNGAQGSVWDYYNEASYGSLDLQTTVTVWVTLPRTAAFYGTNEFAYQWIDGDYIAPAQLMVKESIETLDTAGFDFAPFDTDSDGYIDAFAVIHQGRGEEAGGGASTIWSHKWAVPGGVTVDGIIIYTYYTAPEIYVSGISTIGVYCHEFGHTLGLPDLYDTDYSSEGVGDWCLMAGGSWNGSGKRPAHLLAWCKKELGWITPTVVNTSQTDLTVNSIHNNASAYRIDYGMAANEFLLIENRQKSGFDNYLDGSGIIITHIDESQGSNSNESRYKVAIVQADGLNHLENNNNDGDAGDPFPGSSNVLEINPVTNPSTDSYDNGDTEIYIYDISNSSASMTFSVNLGSAPAADLKVTIDPAAAVSDGAKWRRVGTSTWLDSGYTETGLPINSVDVEFKETTNWSPPSNNSVNLVVGLNTTSGTYTEKLGSLKVTLGPAGAVSDGAQWRRIGTSTWFNSADTESDLSVGDLDIELKDLANWTTPDNITATISDGVTTQATGTYLPPSGTLKVTIGPAAAVSDGAQWRRTGTSPWFDSGDSETVETGNYTVEFKSITGWDIPSNEDVTVQKDLETTATGTFVQQLGNLLVNISPAGAVTNGAKWRRVGTSTWFDGSATETDIPVGDVEIEYRDAAGYATPASANITITKDNTATINGTYTAQPISLSVSDHQAVSGDEFTVTVTLSQGSGVRAFGLDLVYDPTVFEFSSASSRGDLVPGGWTFDVNNIGGNTIRIGGFGDGDTTLNSGSGSITTINLTAKSDAATGTYSLQITNLTDDISGASTSNGTVEILSCIINYDVNSDGLVTPGDALMVFKHYLGTELITDQCALKKADANGDNAITPGDALIIFKEYLGLN